MPTCIEKDILATIVFYDIFRYPLTILEIYKFLQSIDMGINQSEIKENFRKSEIDLEDVYKALDESDWLKERIRTKDGFYFLKNHEENIQTRRDRHLLAIKRWDKAVKMTKQLRFVPFVRLVGLCNTNPINAISEKSDIDIFIIVKDGRMWTARLFITFLFAIQGQWRRFKISNKLCLSFFVTDEYLDLRYLQKKPYDPYFINWIAIMAPIYERDDAIYKKFQEANKWIGKWFYRFHGFKPSFRRRVDDTSFSKSISSLWEVAFGGSFGELVEKLMKKTQVKYMSREHKTESGRPNTDVVVCDKILKFHENDRREEFRKKFLKEYEKAVEN